MYKAIIRPILFLFQPETIHHMMVFMMKVARYTPFAKSIIRATMTHRDPRLEREVMGIKFPNPIGLAAGFDKNAQVYDILSVMGFGSIEIGSVTPKGQPGNAKPRNFRLPQDHAIINRMGFNNEGAEAVAKNLQKNRRQGLIIGGNLGKNTTTTNENAPQDYLKVFEELYDHCDYFVVNISCPNVSGLANLQSKQSTIEILSLLTAYRSQKSIHKPLTIKLSPDLAPELVQTIVSIALDYGLEGIIATNTTTSRADLTTDPERIKQIGNGGLSGAPLTARSRDMVREIRKIVGSKMAVIGVGGIMTTQDARQMLEAGADLVQVYSGYIYEGPLFMKRICKEILKQR